MGILSSVTRRSARVREKLNPLSVIGTYMSHPRLLVKLPRVLRGTYVDPSKRVAPSRRMLEQLKGLVFIELVGGTSSSCFYVARVFRRRRSSSA